MTQSSTTKHQSHHIFPRLSLALPTTSFLLLLLLLLCHDNVALGLTTSTSMMTSAFRQLHYPLPRPPQRSMTMTRTTTTTLLMSQNSSNESCDSSSSSSSSDEDMSFGDSAVMIPDLDWRVQKLRLEEENKKRFLRAKPRFLPYEDAMKWVQAWGQRWESQEDWQDWIKLGEKRNSYIPSRPDEYYTSTGDWISWEHFLGLNHQ